MREFLLISADWFFLIFHTLFTLFNISGWIFRKMRKAHFITMSATAFSWFVLGIWNGMGYCFCTEWHWQVRQMLGNPIRSHSYIHFLIREISGVNLNPDFVDRSVMIVFVLTVIFTLLVNIKDYLKFKKK